jgi:hypothetical protein
MRTLLDDLSAVEHQNLVRMLYRFERRLTI